jgi:hypothetical protein
MTPEHRANIAAARRRLEEARREDPAWQAMRRASGERLRSDYISSPAAQEKRAKANAEMHRRRLDWCPDDHREEYHRLRIIVGARPAREIIEADIPGTAAHARREVANNTLKMRLRHEREQREAY